MSCLEYMSCTELHGYMSCTELHGFVNLRFMLKQEFLQSLKLLAAHDRGRNPSNASNGR